MDPPVEINYDDNGSSEPRVSPSASLTSAGGRQAPQSRKRDSQPSSRPVNDHKLAKARENVRRAEIGRGARLFGNLVSSLAQTSTQGDSVLERRKAIEERVEERKRRLEEAAREREVRRSGRSDYHNNRRNGRGDNRGDYWEGSGRRESYGRSRRDWSPGGPERSRSRSRSGSRSISRSRSRSRSIDKSRIGYDSWVPRQPGRERSRSRSRSPDRYSRRIRDRSRSGSPFGDHRNLPSPPRAPPRSPSELLCTEVEPQIYFRPFRLLPEDEEALEMRKSMGESADARPVGNAHSAEMSDVEMETGTGMGMGMGIESEEFRPKEDSTAGSGGEIV